MSAVGSQCMIKAIKKKWLVLYRYIYCVLLVAVSVFVCWYLFKGGESFLVWVYKPFANIEPMFKEYLRSLLSIAVWCFLIVSGGAPIKKIGNVLKYPPTWLVCLLSSSVLIGLMNHSLLIVRNALLWQIGFFALAKVLVYTATRIFEPHRVLNADEKRDTIAITELGDKTFIEWIRDDSPIDGEFSDLFERTFIAKNIATAITEKCRKVAVVGPYGSGKTSVINMMRSCIDAEKKGCHYNFCQCDSWGRKAEIIPKYILKSAVKALKSRLDIISLSGYAHGIFECS